MRPCGGLPRTSAMTAGPRNRSSGSSSMRAPSSRKWYGASTWVPVWEPIRTCSTLYPSAATVAAGVNRATGSPGYTGVSSSTGWDRSTIRRTGPVTVPPGVSGSGGEPPEHLAVGGRRRVVPGVRRGPGHREGVTGAQVDDLARQLQLQLPAEDVHEL